MLAESKMVQSLKYASLLASVIYLIYCFIVVVDPWVMQYCSSWFLTDLAKWPSQCM